jgi:ribosomal protein L40E
VSRCPQCQHDNPGDAKFCLECNLRLALKCLACGTELPSGAKFCKECGQAVGGACFVPSNAVRESRLLHSQALG